MYVGQGAAADYEGRVVRGKAVVLDRNDTVGLSDQAATAAGAELLLVVNDGPGLVEPLAFDSIAPLNIATLDQEEGQRLISQATKADATLEMYSDPTTEYLYDVVRKYHNQIRADLSYRPETGDPARVDMSFRNYRPAPATDFRYDVWPESDWWAVGWPELPGQGQGDRTDYVSPDVQYRESAMATGETRVIAADKHYSAGSRTAENWFSPIQRPRISYDSTMLSRQDDALFAFVAGWGDAGADRVGYASDPCVQASTSIYQGDTLLAQSPDYYTYTSGLKPERLPYRIVSEFSRGTWTLWPALILWVTVIAFQRLSTPDGPETARSRFFGRGCVRPHSMSAVSTKTKIASQIAKTRFQPSATGRRHGHAQRQLNGGPS